MPYNNYRKGKRMRQLQRRYYKSNTRTSYARSTWRAIKSIKKRLNTEYKFHDVAANVTIVDASGVITQLSNIDQGLTDITRIGAQIKASFLDVRWNLFANASATTTIVRLMLIEDKQTNQAIYTTADLLAVVTSLNSLVSHKNLDNKYRFRILRDKSFNFSGPNGITTKNGQWRIPLNKRIRYDNTGNGIANITSVSYSLLVIGNEVTNDPNLIFQSRLSYVDN